MTIQPLTERDLEARVLKAVGPVMVDFFQATCPPCRVLEPRLEQLARQPGREVPVYRVDIDRDLAIAERFAVKSIPTVLVMYRGKEVERLDGLITQDGLAGAFARAASLRTGAATP